MWDFLPLSLGLCLKWQHLYPYSGWRAPTLLSLQPAEVVVRRTWYGPCHLVWFQHECHFLSLLPLHFVSGRHSVVLGQFPNIQIVKWLLCSKMCAIITTDISWNPKSENYCLINTFATALLFLTSFTETFWVIGEAFRVWWRITLLVSLVPTLVGGGNSRTLEYSARVVCQDLSGVVVFFSLRAGLWLKML